MVAVLHAEHEVAARPHGTRRGADADAREVQVDLRSELLERGPQQQVVLEAITATPVVDRLPGDVVERQRDGDPAVRIEVLERDRDDMRAVTAASAGRPLRPMRAR